MSASAKSYKIAVLKNMDTKVTTSKEVISPDLV